MADFIFIGSLFCCLISAYLLFFKRKDYNSFSDKLLASLFISYAYATLSYLLVTSGWFIYIPYFYKTGQPISYLIPPLAYLYVRSVLNNESTFKKIDLIHLIPFVFIIINYLPFYLLNESEKLKILKLVINEFHYNYTNQDGIISEKSQILRPIQSLIYLALQWNLYSLFLKNNKAITKFSHTLQITKWIKTFNICISLNVFSFIAFVILFIYGINNSLRLDTIIFYSSIPMSLCLFYISSYLVINPNVLLGLPFINYIKRSESTNPINLIDYEMEIKLILEYFEQHRPYLLPNISINEVSLALGIPLKLLSFIINQNFKLNFNDFVNNYRINSVVQRMRNGDLERFTLRSLSQDAGFSNKTTFLKAFKKVNNTTPSQYIVNIESENIGNAHPIS